MKNGKAKSGDNMRTRQCAVSRDMLNVQYLVRFVEAPDGFIIPDIKANLPGRGVWITCRRDMVTRGIAQGVFARSLKKKISVSPSLADLLDELLQKRALERLSLATKAGLVTKGFVKISKRLEKGGFIALLHAHNGAEDGKRKLDALMKKATSNIEIATNETTDKITDDLAANETDDITGKTTAIESEPIDIFSIDELSLATGGDNVVHALIKEGGASTLLLSDLKRLMSYRKNLELTGA